MDADRLRSRLAGTRFADVRWQAETGSTNADALALARDGAPEGVVVVADHQHAGRGRLGRRWEAPPGSSLLVSVLIRPAAPPLRLALDQVHVVSTALGVAAAEAVRPVTGADVRLKWPNDLVVDTPAGTRKLSGILAESVVTGDRLEALVVGIGINVNWPDLEAGASGPGDESGDGPGHGSGDEPSDALPAELAAIATALNHLAGRPVDRAEVLEALLRGFDRWYGALGTPEGRGALLGRYRELSATLGRRVRVELAGEVVEGDAVDLTADGHLLVVDECPDRPREITVGDVVHLRPGAG